MTRRRANVNDVDKEDARRDDDVGAAAMRRMLKNDGDDADDNARLTMAVGAMMKQTVIPSRERRRPRRC